MQRVEELADKELTTAVDERGFHVSDNGRPPFKSMVSLRQIVSEALGYGPGSKAVHRVYTDLVSQVGNEMAVLLDAPAADISGISNNRVAEGVDCVRSGDISIRPGYDGQYGKVSVWSEPGE